MKIIQNGSKISDEEYQAQIKRSVLLNKKRIKSSFSRSYISDPKRNNKYNDSYTSVSISTDKARLTPIYMDHSDQESNLSSDDGSNRINSSDGKQADLQIINNSDFQSYNTFDDNSLIKKDAAHDELQDKITDIKASKAVKTWRATRKGMHNKITKNKSYNVNNKVSHTPDKIKESTPNILTRGDDVAHTGEPITSSSDFSFYKETNISDTTFKHLRVTHNDKRNELIKNKTTSATQQITKSDYNTSYIRGQFSASHNMSFNKATDPQNLAVAKVQEHARIKGFIKNGKRSVKARYNISAIRTIHANGIVHPIASATSSKSKLYLLLVAFSGLILIVIIMFVLTLVSVFKPQYSTLTMRDLMKIYNEAWSNELTEMSISMTLAESGTFGYLYGDPGIDWRQVLSIYYAALLTETESSPEADLEIASNGSILDNETGSIEGNVFGSVFWLLNDVVETDAITTLIPDPINAYYKVRTGDGITDWDYNVVTADYITCIPIIHRDPETVMDILGFTEWQKTAARMYYNDTAYDSYFAGIINTLNYGSGDVMVYTAQQEIGNTGHIYRSWFVGTPQTGHQSNWCVIFASWCGYQCGYSTSDGQLGIVPKHNDTTGMYNWYVGHPEAGTAYYCYCGAMDPDEIPIQPGSFIIWERDGNTSHQDHLSMITAYYPETHTFDTIDGNSYNTAYAPDEYYVCEHHNRSWSDKIYAVLIPAYPDESLDLEYSPLESAIEEGRYPNNYEDIIAALESINIDNIIINSINDLSVRDAYDRLEWYMNQGVNPISFTDTTYHSGNVNSPNEQNGWTGMQAIFYSDPTMAHLQFYSNIDLPEWYFADGYYSHYRDCNYYSSYRSDVLS